MPLCGITPARIAALIFDLLAKTSAWVVKGPPALMLPAAWQPLLIEQTVVSMGCTSVENFGLIPTHEKVMPPPPGGVGSLLLHAANNMTVKKIKEMIANVLFMTVNFKFCYMSNDYFPE